MENVREKKKKKYRKILEFQEILERADHPGASCEKRRGGEMADAG